MLHWCLPLDSRVRQYLIHHMRFPLYLLVVLPFMVPLSTWIGHIPKSAIATDEPGRSGAT